MIAAFLLPVNTAPGKPANQQAPRRVFFPEASLLDNSNLSRLVSNFTIEGNGSLRRRIQRPEGVMKHRESNHKKQPTRHDYAIALKTIRAQFHTLESQSDTIRRQNQFMVMIWMERTPARRREPDDQPSEESLSRWIN